MTLTPETTQAKDQDLLEGLCDWALAIAVSAVITGCALRAVFGSAQGLKRARVAIHRLAGVQASICPILIVWLTAAW